MISGKAGKGKKDRYTLLSEKLLPLLRDYYKLYKPKEFLFEGRDGGLLRPNLAQVFQIKCASGS